MLCERLFNLEDKLRHWHKEEHKSTRNSSYILRTNIKTMPDLRVQKTESTLEILHDPSSRSWLLFFGVMASGVGAAYVNEESLLWQIVYMLVASTVAFLCFDNWEFARFLKEKGVLEMGRITILEKLTFLQGMLQTVQLSDIVRVDVLEEKVTMAGTGYTVIVELASGITMPLTDQALLADRSRYDELAQEIRTFLDLPDEGISDEDLETTDDNMVEISEEALVEGEKSTATKDEEEKKDEAGAVAPPSEPFSSGEGNSEKSSVPSTPGGSSEEEGFEKIDKAEILQAPQIPANTPEGQGQTPEDKSKAASPDVGKEQ